MRINLKFPDYLAGDWRQDRLPGFDKKVYTLVQISTFFV
jgi:hypothetical protein